jgi:TetR/AcrR family transcriptional repressor of lmrAB and yxaGH operons
MTAQRDDSIAATGRLFERQGYHATGLNRIIEASGAPKESLYDDFPEAIFERLMTVLSTRILLK